MSKINNSIRRRQFKLTLSIALTAVTDPDEALGEIEGVKEEPKKYVFRLLDNGDVTRELVGRKVSAYTLGVPPPHPFLPLCLSPSLPLQFFCRFIAFGLITDCGIVRPYAVATLPR